MDSAYATTCGTSARYQRRWSSSRRLKNSSSDKCHVRSGWDPPRLHWPHWHEWIVSDGILSTCRRWPRAPASNSPRPTWATASRWSAATSLPACADACILKNILHDFADETTLAILRGCRRALPVASRLLVVQEALPPDNAPSVGKLLDVQMLLIGVRVRTEADYRTLYWPQASTSAG
jgi:hypothetical protein